VIVVSLFALLAPGEEHDGRTVPADEFWLLCDGQLVGRYAPEQVRLHEGGAFDLLGPPEAGLRKLVVP
jgi:hypothetical protein